MVEEDLTELDAFFASEVRELKPHLLGVTMELWECDSVPVPHSEVELSASDFDPAALEWVPLSDVNYGWRHSGVITSTLERDASEL